MSCSIVDRHRCQWQAWEEAVIVMSDRWNYDSPWLLLDRTMVACKLRNNKLWYEGYGSIVGKAAVKKEIEAIKAIAVAMPSEKRHTILAMYVKAIKLEKLLKEAELLGYKTTMVQEINTSRVIPIWEKINGRHRRPV